MEWNQIKDGDAEGNAMVADALRYYESKVGAMNSPEVKEDSGFLPSITREEIFSPVTTIEDVRKRGLVDENDNDTELGEAFQMFKGIGVLDEDGRLNENGKALLATREQSLADTDEGFSLWVRRKELGVEKNPKTDWGEAFGGLFKSIAMIPATVDAFLSPGEDKDPTDRPWGLMSMLPGAEEHEKTMKAEQATLRASGIEGIVGGTIPLVEGAKKLVGDATVMALSEGDEEKMARLKLSQNMHREFDAVEKFNVANSFDLVTESKYGWGREMDQAKETLGEERFAELVEGGRGATNLLSPTGAPIVAVAAKAAMLPVKTIARSAIKAEARALTLVKTKSQIAHLTALSAKHGLTAQKAAKGSLFAEKQMDKLTSLATHLESVGDKAGAIAMRARAKQVGTFAKTLSERATLDAGRVAKIQAELAKKTQLAEKLAKNAATTNRVIGMMTKARELQGAPITGVGKVSSGLGAGLTAVDKMAKNFAQNTAVGKAIAGVTSVPGVMGASALLGYATDNPLIASIPFMVKAGLRFGKPLSKVGRFAEVMGKEAGAARKTIPYWQRVGDAFEKNTASRLLADTFDTAMLGGRIPRAGIAVGKGIAAGAPVDLAYEYVGSGGEFDMSNVRQGLAESLFFGSTGAAMGGMSSGSRKRITNLQNQDMLNLYRELPDIEQRALFNAMPGDVKRSLGVFAGAYPNLEIEFISDGSSQQIGNKVIINPFSKYALKPLVAHELNHFLLIRNQMEDGVAALLVGDGVNTGGVLRNADGKMDESFSKFSDEYNRRMAGIDPDYKPISIQRMAVEYFVDSMADELAGTLDSGEFRKQATKMAVTKKIQAIGDTIMNRSAFLKDLHHKLGGIVDNQGRTVVGTGLVSTGLKNLPEMRKMFKDMMKDSAGNPGFIPGNSADHGGFTFPPIRDKNDPMIDVLADSQYEQDQYGRPKRDKDGNPILITKETEQTRASAGLPVIMQQQNKIANGLPMEEGEIRFNPDSGVWSGKYLTDANIATIANAAHLNPRQIRNLKLFNKALKEQAGTTFSVINNAATERTRKGKLRYASKGPSSRIVAPFSIEISSKGAINIGLISINQLRTNVLEMAAKDSGKRLYGGDIMRINEDVSAWMDAHSRGEPTDAYFKKKYGDRWQAHKNFINAVFGEVAKSQRDSNPSLRTEKPRRPVVKTYRIDRLNKVVEMNGGEKFFYNNNLHKVNFAPEGEFEATKQVKMPGQRMLPEPGTPAHDAAYLEAAESGDMATAQRMVDELIQSFNPSGKLLFTGQPKGLTSIPEATRTELPGAYAFLTDSRGVAERYAGTADSELNSDDNYSTDRDGEVYAVAAFFGNTFDLDSSVDYDLWSKYFAPDNEVKDAYEEWLDEDDARLERISEKYGIEFDQDDLNATRKQVVQAAFDDYGLLKTRRKIVAAKLGLNLDDGEFINPNTQTTFPFDFEMDDVIFDLWKDSYGQGYFSQDAMDESPTGQAMVLFPKVGEQILKDGGYDSMSHSDSEVGGTTWIATTPNQIKSADPVTYDADGNVIPLSQRFNPASDSIRYMPEPLDGAAGDAQVSRMITPEMDAAYLDAAKKRDKGNAENMVMDAFLNVPRAIPTDLQQAWDIGQRVKGMGEEDAVRSGKVPSWVFDFGHETNEFFDAGRRDEVPVFTVGWRRGGIPERGRSTNWADNTAEPGVSLAYAHNELDAEPNSATMGRLDHRGKTFISGWAFPKSRWGSDGEIVIVGAKEFKIIEKDKSGKIIPLSQRFNPASDSIRYMPEPLDASGKDGGVKKNNTGTQPGNPAVTPEQDARYLELAKDPERNRGKITKLLDSIAEMLGLELRFHGSPKGLKGAIDSKNHMRGATMGLFTTNSKRAAWVYANLGGMVTSKSDIPGREKLESLKAEHGLSPKIHRLYIDTSSAMEYDPQLHLKAAKSIHGPDYLFNALAYENLIKTHNYSALEDGLEKISLREFDGELQDEMNERGWHEDPDVRLLDMDDAPFAEFMAFNGEEWSEALEQSFRAVVERNELEIFNIINDAGAFVPHEALAVSDEPRLQSLMSDYQVYDEYLKRSEAKVVEYEDKETESYLGAKSTTTIVIDPSVAFNGDPIIRDKAGNVIPLSQRFNPKSDDIRYMPEPLDKGGKSGGVITPEIIEKHAAEWSREWNNDTSIANRTKLSPFKDALVSHLIDLSKRHDWEWGVGFDGTTRGFPWISYFETPAGQISFHGQSIVDVTGNHIDQNKVAAKVKKDLIKAFPEINFNWKTLKGFDGASVFDKNQSILSPRKDRYDNHIPSLPEKLESIGIPGTYDTIREIITKRKSEAYPKFRGEWDGVKGAQEERLAALFGGGIKAKP